MEGSTPSPTFHANEYEPTPKKLFLCSMIRMIAACAHNRVMGAGGTLPWKIKADWDYFLDTTKDGVLIMGRRCYEDFTEYARTRQVVALSRDPEIVFPHACKASNLPDGIKLAQSMGKDVWICGGEKVYRDAMTLAEELYITLIDAHFEGDVHFPPWEQYFNREISRKEIFSEGQRLTFLVLGK